MRPAQHLIVFAKTPRLGGVKRRLARGIGDVAATAFHRSTIRAMLRRLGRDSRWRCVLAATPDRERNDPLWHRLGAAHIARIGQGSGDLGARMGRALRAMPPGPAVLIGTDIPAIRPNHIAAAFRVLDGHDVAFGPAEDGGYWLVGLKHARRLPRLFEGVRWSSEHALADTIANVSAHLSVALIDELADIDDADAHRTWRKDR